MIPPGKLLRRGPNSRKKTLMQTKNFLVALGAAAVLAAPIQAMAAPDNEAQAKMREALRLKMEQLNEPAAPVAPVAPAAPAAPAAPKAPSPTPVAPAPVTDPDTEARLREALRQQTAPAPAPKATVVAPVPLKAAPAPTSSAVFSEVPDNGGTSNDAALREALRTKPVAAPVAAAPAAPVTSQPTPKAQPAAEAIPTFVATPAAAPAPTRSNLTANMEAPPSPLTSAQETKLADLLARYRADQISAQEYHTQRAAIIAAP
jgi:hypothetical protein